jgi:hypothetical protein
MTRQQFIERSYNLLLSEGARRRFERFILTVAIIGFVIHLLLIFMAQLHWLPVSESAELLTSPIAAAYTPFSFILVYEVYLLVYYLPKSITTYISKQYEIITLIIIRQLFKDLAAIEISANWFKIRGDLLLTYDIVASLLLFYLLHLFINQGRKRYGLPPPEGPPTPQLAQFILFKKCLATLLIPILFCLASYTLMRWTLGVMIPSSELGISFKNLNNVFFDQFFSVLIIVDVILLLFSLFLTNDFHKVIRNSGFIISTILIRLSFSADGLVSTILIIASVVFGLLILLIYNQYEKSAAENIGHSGAGRGGAPL